jgi:site-specific recombinase XerD
LKDGAIVYEASLRIDGAKKRVVLRARTVTEAIRELEALRVDRDRGTVNENPLINPTVSELLDELIEHMEARVQVRDEKRRYAQQTVDRARTSAQRVKPLLQGKRVGDLTARDLRRVVDQLEAKGFAPLTVSRTMGTIGVALNFAVKNGYVDRNVWRDVGTEDRPGGRRLTEPRYLAVDELDALFRQANADHRPIYMLLFHVALRISEALGLIWDDIDFKAGTIDVQAQLSADRTRRVRLKTRSSYAVMEMPPALARELFAHRSRQAERNLQRVRGEAFVFAAESGAGLGRNNVGQHLSRDAQAVGLTPAGAQPVGPHDLRHSAAALAFESGASVVEVCELMRHANPAVTLGIYAGLTKDGRGGAARKMREAGIGL